MAVSVVYCDVLFPVGELDTFARFKLLTLQGGTYLFKMKSH